MTRRRSRARWGRRAAVVVLGLLPPLLHAAPASAHPLGSFTVNRYAGILLAPGEVRVDYVLDMAEIPTFQELPRVDADGDGVASAPELAAWARVEATAIGGGLALTVDGGRVPLSAGPARAGLLPGQGGLRILRLEATFTAPLPRSGRAAFEDRNAPGRIGWREITVASLPGVGVERSSVPATSVSDRLRSYPEDLLSSPLRTTSATFSFGPGPGTAGAPAPRGPTAARPTADGGLAGLVAHTASSPAFLALSLALAFGFGALHALGPGHGKTLVAAYLVGSGGGVRDAVRVGLAVAGMHCASVLVLGVGILVAGRSFAPERAYPWVAALAGGGAAALGAGLLASRVRGLRRGAGSDAGPGDAHPDPLASAEGPGRPHDHERPDDRRHRRAHGHPHAHGHPSLRRGSAPPAGLVSLALAGGILPSPSALLTLLAAVAPGRLAFGLAMIAAFSAGLAATLMAVGAIALRAREAVGRRVGERWRRAVPIGSAAALLLVGAAMAARGLSGL
ncbi:MAG TPA: nickel transporter [Actinomycetota bacterium]|nr:nickel transporter [Actinomycetota bacterium]